MHGSIAIKRQKKMLSVCTTIENEYVQSYGCKPLIGNAGGRLNTLRRCQTSYRKRLIAKRPFDRRLPLLPPQ